MSTYMEKTNHLIRVEVPILVTQITNSFHLDNPQPLINSSTKKGNRG